LVPPEKLLDIKLEEGLDWDTICPFLGLEVPNVPYPPTNDSEQFQKDEEERYRKNIVRALGNILNLAVIPLFVSGALAWYMQRR
jgi:hypothetical protein